MADVRTVLQMALDRANVQAQSHRQ
jgi:hypothetical protein